MGVPARSLSLPPPPNWANMTPAEKAEVHRLNAEYYRSTAKLYRSRRSSGCGFSFGSFLLGYLFGGND